MRKSAVEHVETPVAWMEVEVEDHFAGFAGFAAAYIAPTVDVVASSAAAVAAFVAS